MMEIELGTVSVAVWPIASCILIAILVVLHIKKYSLPYILCVFLFGLYLLFASDKVFFPIPIAGDFADAARQSPFGGEYSPRYNIVPFSLGPYPDLSRVVLTSFLNVLLTLPFGFGLPFLVPLKTKQIWWISCVVGISLEGLQLLISLTIGFLYRVIDVNDVIFNALGVSIGYIIFCLFGLCWLALTKHCNHIHSDRAHFLYEVVTRSISQN